MIGDVGAVGAFPWGRGQGAGLVLELKIKRLCTRACLKIDF